MKTNTTQSSVLSLLSPLLAEIIAALIRRYGRRDLSANDIKNITHLVYAVHDRDAVGAIASLLERGEKPLLSPASLLKLQSELLVSATPKRKGRKTRTSNVA